MKKCLMSLLLFFLVCLAFWPAVRFDFINFDDIGYVASNPFVLGQAGWNYVFTGTASLGIWFPVTLASYRLDALLGGLSPDVFHLSNIVWHGLVAVVLFQLVLAFIKREETSGHLWPMLVAFSLVLIWAVHPQRIESVVWIAGRKDLTCGLFGVISLIGYLKSIRAGRYKEGWYGLSVLSLLLASMSKPTAMTIPVGMAVLELVAAGRISWRRLVLPLVIAVACGGIAIWVQALNQGVTSVDGIMNNSLTNRLLLSFSALGYYWRSSVWPDGICIMHPWPVGIPWPFLLLGVGATVGVTAWGLVDMVRWVRHGKQPNVYAFLALGFIVSLVPMLSLFSFGYHAWADRFTYYPSMFLVLLSALFLSRQGCGRYGWKAGLLVSLLAGYVVWMRMELPHWRDTIRVFERAVAASPRNPFAHCRLGESYIRLGDAKRAMDAFQRSVKDMPNDENLGGLAITKTFFTTSGDLSEAAELAQKALKYDRSSPAGNEAMGFICIRTGQWPEAARHLTISIKSRADNPLVFEWLAMAQFNQGKYRESLASIERAIEINPSNQALRERQATIRQRLEKGYGPRK